MGHGLYMGLSCQPAWHDSTVVPESLAQQAGAHAPPRQLRSMLGATTAGLVAPVHVPRQRGTIALAHARMTKRVIFANIFLELVLKYLFKKD